MCIHTCIYTRKTRTHAVNVCLVVLALMERQKKDLQNLNCILFRRSTDILAHLNILIIAYNEYVATT